MVEAPNENFQFEKEEEKTNNFDRAKVFCDLEWKTEIESYNMDEKGEKEKENVRKFDRYEENRRTTNLSFIFHSLYI